MEEPHALTEGTQQQTAMDDDDGLVLEGIDDDIQQETEPKGAEKPAEGIKPAASRSWAAMEQGDKLSAPDRVMHYGVRADIEQYVKAGGTAEDALERLASGYVGYAHAINFVTNTLVEDLEMHPDSVSKLIVDSARGLVMKSFDSEMVDTKFNKEFQGEAPAWIDELVSSKDWRNMIYDLARSFKTSALINFILQRIAKAGYEKEVAAVSASHVSVSGLQSLIADDISKICSAKSNKATTDSALENILRICRGTEHAYTYVQGVLSVLIEDKSNDERLDGGWYRGTLKRVRQEMEAGVPQEHRDVRQKVAAFYPACARERDLARIVLSIVSDRRASPNDITKIYDALKAVPAPSSDCLQHPDLFEVLLRRLFSVETSLSAEHKKMCMYIVAYAAAVPASSCPGVADEKELEDTLAALEKAAGTLNGMGSATQMTGAFPDLKEAMRFPVVSMGVLHWIGDHLKNPRSFMNSYHGVRAPVWMKYFQEVCTTHPIQTPRIHQIMRTCMDADNLDLDGMSLMNMKKRYMDTMAMLVRVGYAVPVLDNLYQLVKTKHLDQAIVRYVLSKVLEDCQPPYEADFARPILQLLALEATSMGIRASGTFLYDTVLAFIGHVRKLGRSMPDDVSDLIVACEKLLKP